MPGAEELLRRIRALAGQEGPLACAVAWSGGLDSTLLLSRLVEARRLHRGQLRLRAIHVDHGLQPAAARFRRFCELTARGWRVPLTVLRPRVALPPGGSLEEAARRARRAALAQALAPGELLLAAQHADDQLETLLLALVRGAGPRGLAAMPPCMPLGRGRMVRPLLDVERAAIEAAAREAGLSWVEDPTNSDTRFDRNFLRVHVLPLLRGRWPSVAATVARSARHCASAAAQLEALAARDLEAASDGTDLDIAVLRRFTATRRAAVLRAWIQKSGGRAPNERHLGQVEAMMAARPDAHPLLVLPDCKVRRVGGRLVLER